MATATFVSPSVVSVVFVFLGGFVGINGLEVGEFVQPRRWGSHK